MGNIRSNQNLRNLSNFSLRSILPHLSRFKIHYRKGEKMMYNGDVHNIDKKKFNL